MYLIHVRLKEPEGAAVRPDLAGIVMSYTEEADGLEHVTVTPGPACDVTLGLFLLADDLREAEKAAARLARQAVSDHPELRGFRLLDAGAVLVPGPWWSA
ncbi:hypothetical protein NGF19_19955 [Streptomyces sp. RY43-2]|uniref:YCII-related domain-containing protein n=1 Tax=Streptomyces macrolidinus TaxID=2952607 RepID=A0ABT0ZHL1_9ACTN|nr:hypothetical protein [Streptomyces macrolidinus]MCN9243045.1 hypothetical protein [Streptomyces macrolidinus]